MLRNTFQCTLIETKNEPDGGYHMTETEDTKFNATINDSDQYTRKGSSSRCYSARNTGFLLT